MSFGSVAVGALTAAASLSLLRPLLRPPAIPIAEPHQDLSPFLPAVLDVCGPCEGPSPCPETACAPCEAEGEKVSAWLGGAAGAAGGVVVTHLAHRYGRRHEARVEAGQVLGDRSV